MIQQFAVDMVFVIQMINVLAILLIQQVIGWDSNVLYVSQVMKVLIAK